jgi:hypothetical protein
LEEQIRAAIGEDHDSDLGPEDREEEKPDDDMPRPPEIPSPPDVPSGPEVS